MKLIPPPPKWDRTVDGLAGSSTWVSEFERSFLPPDIVFPRVGQIWETVRDCEVTFIAFIPKTILPCGRARLQQGERVRILTEEPKPTRITFQPVRYQELHSVIVPEEIRERPGYSYYWLSLRIARTPCCLLHEEPGFFHELFHLVPDVA
jgi:hypothetical protein